MDLFAVALRKGLITEDGIIKINNDNKSNQMNSNKGTNGTNLQYDKAQGNRGKQLNPKTTLLARLVEAKSFGKIYIRPNIRGTAVKDAIHPFDNIDSIENSPTVPNITLKRTASSCRLP